MYFKATLKLLKELVYKNYLLTDGVFVTGPLKRLWNYCLSSGTLKPQEQFKNN